MPAQHRDVCQPSAMDDGIIYRPNLNIYIYIYILKLCCVNSTVNKQQQLHINKKKKKKNGVKPYLRLLLFHLVQLYSLT